MSQRHPIDDFFKSRLVGYDSGAPMSMWDKIEARQKRRRRLRQLGWLTGGLSLALLSIMAYQFASSASPASDSPLDAFPIRTTTTATDSVQSGNPAPQSGAPLDEATITLQHTTRNSSRLNTPLPTDQPVGSPAPPYYGTIAATTARTAPAVASFSATPSMPTPIAITDFDESYAPRGETTASTTAPQAPCPAPLTLEGWTAVEEAETINEPILEAAGVMPSVETQETSYPAPSQAADPSEYRLSGPHLRANMRALPQLPQVQPPSHLSKLPVWRPMTKPTACVNFRRQTWMWAIEALGGAAIAHPGFSLRDQELDGYLQKRKTTERERISYAAEIRALAALPFGLRVRAGVQYLQLNSRFQYENPDVLEIHIMPRVGPNGEVTGADTTYSPYLHNTANRYQWINVPLLAGYEGKCGKLRAGFMVGPVINLLFNAEGEMLAPETNQPNYFGQVGETQVLPAYRAKAGLSWYGAVSMAYHFNGRQSLIAEAFIQKSHRSLTTEAYALRHLPFVMGLQVGMRTAL